MSNEHLATNLRLLCNQIPSVASVCRAINVNRQQFNKYLAGTHRPSPYNLSRICRFFGLEEFELLLPPEQFGKILARFQDHRRQTAPAGLETLLNDIFPANDRTLERYQGYYHSHFAAYGWDDRIVRSLICFYLRDGRMHVKSIERFADSVLNQNYTMKSAGWVSMMANRLYVVEHQTISGGKVSLTILNGTYQSRVTLLNGLTMGTSTHRDHLPAVSRVVYKYLGRTIDARAALSACGAFRPGSGMIDTEILRRIANDIAPDEHVLFGRQG